MTYALTSYAVRSATSRGVRRDALDLLLLVADRATHLNCESMCCRSPRQAQRLRRHFGDAIISRVERTNVLVDEHTNTVVSVLRGRLAPEFRPGAGRHRRGGPPSRERRH